MASSSRRKSDSSASNRAAGAQFESQTIGSIRRDRERSQRQMQRERREQMRRQQKRRSKLPFIIVGVIIFLAISFLGMYMILSRTNVFEIEEIEITGTEHLTQQEVSALVSIPKGTTLLNIDINSISASLERDAWVKIADVEKVYPNKIKIDVTERKIGAVVEVPTGVSQTIQNWAIADDDMWLMAIPSRDTQVGSQLSEQIYSDADSAIHIVGVPYGIEPAIGTYCTDENVKNALAIMSGMTTELADKLKFVTATDTESTLLTLNSNIEIAFGTATNIREKERICLQILKENPKVVYINVRVPDRPIWRSA